MGNEPQEPFARRAESSALALWEVITCIHYAGSLVTSATENVPKKYGFSPRWGTTCTGLTDRAIRSASRSTYWQPAHSKNSVTQKLREALVS